MRTSPCIVVRRLALSGPRAIVLREYSFPPFQSSAGIIPARKLATVYFHMFQNHWSQSAITLGTSVEEVSGLILG
jgi:hypothetical protein